MDLSGADSGYGLRVESSREIPMTDGDVGDPRGVAYAGVEVEVSWLEKGRGRRERVDLFAFKELYREAVRRGLPVALAPGYAHKREAAGPALSAEGGEPGPEAAQEPEEKFNLLALVRSLLRQERESLGPAYG